MPSDLVASRRFALASAALGAGFGVPILLAPHKWARAFGWPDVPETDESRYSLEIPGWAALGICARKFAPK
ncbi:MAG TPA: hypothetical protein VMZ00_14310 [Sporichthya sp.]|nr:hypothetical protein [Sporichthya sp.]